MSRISSWNWNIVKARTAGRNLILSAVLCMRSPMQRKHAAKAAHGARGE